jgi:hypothetical protein
MKESKETIRLQNSVFKALTGLEMVLAGLLIASLAAFFVFGRQVKESTYLITTKTQIVALVDGAAVKGDISLITEDFIVVDAATISKNGSDDKIVNQIIINRENVTFWKNID